VLFVLVLRWYSALIRVISVCRVFACLLAGTSAELFDAVREIESEYTRDDAEWQSVQQILALEST